MNCCQNYSRSDDLPHDGVGGANRMSQRRWRLALFAPLHGGTDTAVQSA
jgi:hypothetical protein